MLPSCVLLGGFAIGARVSLLWQHAHLMRNVSEDVNTSHFLHDVFKVRGHMFQFRNIHSDVYELPLLFGRLRDRLINVNDTG